MGNQFCKAIFFIVKIFPFTNSPFGIMIVSMNKNDSIQTVIDPVRASDIRHRNIMAVLAAIYASRGRGGASQSDIVNRIGLKAPSVFRIFTYLEQNGYIVQCGTGKAADESRKGRHPVYYTVRPDAVYTIGIDFWASCLSLGVFDFNRHRIYSHLEYLDDSVDAARVEDLICSLVEKAISDMELSREKIAGIGIAAPGKVNVARGSIVFYSKIKGMDSYPLRDNVEKRLGYRVMVHNNCSALAYSVYRYGDKDPGKALFAFLVRGGVNGAMVSENGIYTSADGTTLEAGHIPVNFDGPKCSCGLKGCLQAYMLELDSKLGTGPDQVLFSSITDTKDPKSAEVLKKAAFYLFTSMKTIQRSLSPDSFLIISPSIMVAETMAQEIRELYKGSDDYFQARDPNVFAMAYDNVMAQAGASDLVLDEFFDS